MARKKNAPDLEALTRPEALPATDELPLDGAPDVAPDEAAEERVRKPRAVDAATAALFPADVAAADLPERVHAAVRAWREANDREVPSVDRLVGSVERVDVDAASGYVAVVTSEDTWRAFLPREQLAAVVALLVRRPVEEVARVVAEGPGPVAAAPPRV